MGCSGAKNRSMMRKLNEQESKISELVVINERLALQLESYRADILQTKSTTEPSADYNSFKLNMDSRFTRLEKSIEKIQEDLFRTQMKDYTEVKPIERSKFIYPGGNEIRSHKLSEKKELGVTDDSQWKILLKDDASVWN